MPTIEELEAKLARMEERLQLLEARLDAEAGLRRGSMRESRRCPACGHSRIFQMTRLAIRFLGFCQAFICASCGHTELQLEDPTEIEMRKDVTLLPSPEKNEGPYR